MSARGTPKTSVICSISRITQQLVRLDAVVVSVLTPTGLARLLVFVGSSSDTNSISWQSAQKQLSKVPMPLAVSTVCGAQVMAAGRMNLLLVSLDNCRQIDPADAYRLADLRMRSPKFVDAVLSRWAHFRDVSVTNSKGERIDLLPGCKVP